MTATGPLAEVNGWALREKKPFEDMYRIIRRNSAIVHSQLEDWLRAAELRSDIRRKVPGFGMMDALLLAAAQRSARMILTGDAHFKKMASVAYLGP